MRDVRALSADKMQGRGLGTEGLRGALYFVAERFARLGLQPPATAEWDGEKPLDRYLQRFEISGHPATANVIGVLPANPSEAGSPTGSGASSLVIGAHIDHLGIDRAVAGDQVYNGADDNASGVAAMLEIARILAANRDNERPVVFIAFSGEESGLLGSKYYTAHPAVALNATIAMLNLDSIGRLRDDKLYIFGEESTREWPALLAGVNSAFGLEIVPGDKSIGGSDQVSFTAASVPALHFFTGPHEDYSKVSDHADLVSAEGLARVTDYVAEVARYLAYRDRPLLFVEDRAAATRVAPPAVQPSGRRASLGFMPDFAAGSEGVGVAQVTPGGPAQTAGLKAGDRIVAIDDEPVGSLADYTAILGQHAPGDRVRVKAVREGSSLEVEAVLAERR
jgi:hypothetical protein